MPKIREYQQRESARIGTPGRAIRPSDIGDGAAIQNFGAEVGGAMKRIEDHKERLEVTEAHRFLAEAQADWSNHLRERELAAESGDESFGETFNADLKTYIDEGRNNFQTIGGQQAYERGASALSANFVAQSGAATARLIGARARSNFDVIVDSFHRILANDPSQFQNIREQLNGVINNPDGEFFRIDAAIRPELERKALGGLAKTAMESTILIAPKLGLQYLENPESNASQYLLDDDLIDLKGRAEAGIERQKTAAAREKAAARLEEQDRMDAIRTELTTRIMDPTAEKGIPTDEEIGRSGLDGPGQQNIAAFRDTHLRNLISKSDRSNPAEVTRLHLELIDGKVYNTDNIDAAYRTGAIGKTDWMFLTEQVSELKNGHTKSFAQDFHSTLGNSIGAISNSPFFIEQPDLAGEAISRLRSEASAKVKEFRDANKDPRALLNPESKDFFFSAANIRTFMVPVPQMLQRGADATLQGEIESGAATIQSILPTQESFSNLKTGDIFVGPDGETRVKTKSVSVTRGRKVKTAGFEDGSEILPTYTEIENVRPGGLFTDSEGNIRTKTRSKTLVEKRQNTDVPIEDISRIVPISELISGKTQQSATDQYPTYKEYETLQPGDLYTDPGGNIRKKQ